VKHVIGRAGIVGLTLVLASALAFEVFSARSPQARASTVSTVWRMGYLDQIDQNANIFSASEDITYFIFTEVYDIPLNPSLATTLPSTRYSPVSRYVLSDQGKTITYYLRPHLRWSDGKPLTSADFVWSWEHNQYGVSSEYTAALKSIKALSPTEVVVHLKHYDARLLADFIPILPEHIWGKLSNTQLLTYDPCCPIVGSGPFYVKSLNPNGTTVLLPNPYFYGPRGHIKEILLIHYDDPNAALRDLELGNLDAVFHGLTTWLPALRHYPHIRLWAGPGYGFDEVAFNMCPPHGSPICTRPSPSVHVDVVQNLAIRQALQWAINRAALAKQVYNGLAAPATGLISNAYTPLGYYTNFKNDPSIDYRYDPAKSLEVLHAGGWRCPPLNSGGVCMRHGVPAEFTLMLRSADLQEEQEGLRVQSWARAVGIKINIEVTSDDAIDTAIDTYSNSSNPKDRYKYEPSYDAFLWDWNGGDPQSPDYDMDQLQCGSSYADSMWCNQRYTALTNEALQERNFHKRVALLHEAEKLELYYSPYVLTVYSPYIFVTRTDTWHGYRRSPAGFGWPFGMSWEQLQLIQPGRPVTDHYLGAPIVVLGAAALTGLFVGLGRLRRRRLERMPLETDEDAGVTPP
jgi:peptide/nickel transport system substrate-binding protein